MAKGVQAIAPALAGIRGLVLSGNGMGASGAAAHAQALPAFARSLERLDSSWCGIGSSIGSASTCTSCAIIAVLCLP